MTHFIIPMAGRGQRFIDAGYETPKPFIGVCGVTMVERVLKNLPLDSTSNITLITLALHEDWDSYLRGMANLYFASIIRLNEITGGAACTVMEALDEEAEGDVIVANSDQYLDWAPVHFLNYARSRDADGCVATFRASGAKWSYADVKEDGTISAIAEKVPISHDATCGVYYYKNARILKNAILQMMAKKIMTNGEFYLAPAYNEMITDGMKIYNYPVPRMFGMGTPEDLKITIESGIFEH